MRQSDGVGPQQDVYDITIIGAGPTGLFAACFAGLREVRTKIIEPLSDRAGRVSQRH